MRHQKPISKRAQETLKKLLEKSKTKSEYRRTMCVMLRATLQLPAQKIAENVGLSRGAVEQIIARYLKSGAKSLLGSGSGGRQYAYMSIDEERQFVKDFGPKALDGGIIVVNEIIRAYEKKVGFTVAKSTVYRLLARYGWRKIAPRRQHPKADREKQLEFKKKFPSKT
jgi:transposase